jgi:hypothetical protein
MRMTRVVSIYLLFLCILNIFCYNRSTSKTADGDGDIIYLDRQKVYCGTGEVLGGFDMNASSGKQNFEYDCFSTKSIFEDTYYDYTGWNDAAGSIFSEGKSGPKFRDHRISCRNNYVLRGWNLESDCSGWGTCNIRVKYQCVAAKIKSCTSYTTGWTYADKGYTYKMGDMQAISLGSYQALQSFKMETDDWDSWFVKYWNFRWSYTYCSLRNIEAESIAYLQSVNSGSDYTVDYQ